MTSNKTYNADTQTLISSNKKEYIDVETGERIHVDQITKRAYGTKQFWKMYLMDFLSVLGIMDNKQLDIFVYICENTNASNNMFIGTYKKIMKDVKVSSKTVATIMKKLQENGFIKKVQNGVWLINPNIMMKGNDTKRQILVSYYEADEPIEKITVNRTKQKAIETIDKTKPKKPTPKTKALAEKPPVKEVKTATKEKKTTKKTTTRKPRATAKKKGTS